MSQRDKDENLDQGVIDGFGHEWAAFDYAETETAVIDSIIANKNNITILMISHKLSTLQHCNEIIELESGNIINKITSVRLKIE